MPAAISLADSCYHRHPHQLAQYREHQNQQRTGSCSNSSGSVRLPLAQMDQVDPSWPPAFCDAQDDDLGSSARVLSWLNEHPDGGALALANFQEQLHRQSSSEPATVTRSETKQPQKYPTTPNIFHQATPQEFFMHDDEDDLLDEPHDAAHYLDAYSSLIPFALASSPEPQYCCAIGAEPAEPISAIQSSDGLLSPPTNTSHHHYLTIEELRSALNSCLLCGCDWQEDHISLDCSECGGFGLSRPCPKCEGKCKQVWKRNINATHDSHKALWVGKCSLEKSGPKLTTGMMKDEKSKLASSSTCCSSFASSSDSHEFDSHHALQLEASKSRASRAAKTVLSLGGRDEAHEAAAAAAAAVASAAEADEENNSQEQEHLCIFEMS